MPHRFIISGGGTGGHIFPAIAIANSIKDKEPDAEILFVGAKGRMEMEKIPSAGYKIIGLNISGISRSFSLSNLKVPFKFLMALMQAGKILREFKPDVVIGVGGYASSAILFAAARKKIPSVIQEQNSFAGVTNKLLGRNADKICVAYEGMEKFFQPSKIVITGNPVRKEIINIQGKKERGFEFFKLNPEKFTLLVIGGSLGAQSINQGIEKNLKKFHENGIQLIWQTGKNYYPRAAEAVAKVDPESLKAFDFIGEMDLAYSVADLIVSRAGAIAVSELCIVEKPAILVPFPYATEDHQTHNAMALVNRGAARMIKDSSVSDKLGEEILTLFINQKERDEMTENLKALGKPNATELIVGEIFRLIR